MHVCIEIFSSLISWINFYTTTHVLFKDKKRLQMQQTFIKILIILESIEWEVRARTLKYMYRYVQYICSSFSLRSPYEWVVTTNEFIGLDTSLLCFSIRSSTAESATTLSLLINLCRFVELNSNSLQVWHCWSRGLAALRRSICGITISKANSRLRV